MLISLERFVAVLYPANVYFKKKAFQIASIVVLMICLALLNIPAILYAAIVKNLSSSVLSCRISKEQYLAIANAYDIIDSLIFSLIPFLFMTIFSTVVSLKLFNSKALKQTMNKKNKNIQFTLTVMIIDALFLILNAPICVCSVLYIYYAYAHV